MIQKVIVNRAVEDYHPDMFVRLESADDFLELPDHFRAHDIDGRVVERDTPIGGRPPCQANLCGFRWCVRSCHDFSFVVDSLNAINDGRACLADYLILRIGTSRTTDRADNLALLD